MVRRSAQNPRYRKDAKIGSTRKSASSMRPKKPGSESAKDKKGRGGARGPRRQLVERIPTTPEMRRWRRVWWVLIAIALAFAAAVWVPGVRGNRQLTGLAIGLELAFLGGALYIDFTIIRRLRNEALKQKRAGGKDGQRRKDS